jgi:hypothetical protein
MVTNEVIVRNPNGFGVILFSPRVKHFTMAGHHFIYFDEHSKLAGSPAFYDQVSSGKMTVLVKRHKWIYEKLVGVEVEQKFEVRNSYVIFINGEYHNIKNLEDILSFTGSKKGEIRKMLKKNRIRFKKDTESAMIKIAEYFNQA